MPLVIGALLIGLVLLAGKSIADARGVDARRAMKWGLSVLLLAVGLLLLFRAGLHGLAIAGTAALVLVRGLMGAARVLPALGVLLRFFGGARSAGIPGGGNPAPPGRRMTRQEACEVLGVAEGATRNEILQRYRDLMKRVHPDKGGSTDLAKRINEAKDVLLRGR